MSVNYFRHALLRFAAQRFKAYRALTAGEGLIKRSLIIEDTKRGRFFEISYDEVYCEEGIESLERTNEGCVLYLSDILICISRMTFDAFLYNVKGVLTGGNSIEDALALGSRDRGLFWDRVAGTLERPESGSECATREVGAVRVTLHEPTFDQAADSPEHLIQRLTQQVAKRTGSKGAYWHLLSAKDEPKIPQQGEVRIEVLTFGNHSS